MPVSLSFSFLADDARICRGRGASLLGQNNDSSHSNIIWRMEQIAHTVTRRPAGARIGAAIAEQQCGPTAEAGSRSADGGETQVVSSRIPLLIDVRHCEAGRTCTCVFILRRNQRTGETVAECCDVRGTDQYARPETALSSCLLQYAVCRDTSSCSSGVSLRRVSLYKLRRSIF